MSMRITLVAVCLITPAASVQAYVDLAPTLGSIVRDAQVVALAEVERCNLEKGALILKVVRPLKGQIDNAPIRHHLLRAGQGTLDRNLLDWAEPGRRCLLFISDNTALVCLGQAWYQVQAGADGWWRIGADRPDLPLAYWGTVSRLSEAVERMVAGQTAVITTLPHGAGQEGASFDIALNRAALPGLVKVQRLRANLRMPPMVMAVSAHPAYLVGQGPAGVEDIPTLRKKLGDADPLVRAESAADLGTLGAQAAAAAEDLERLLDDANSSVRLAAAAALCRITPQAKRPPAVLATGLESADAAIRRQAARATGLAGPAAMPLADRLGKLLADPDQLTRRLALQAIATLGPAAAAAQPAVQPLLDRPETVIDAADALGRMGPAARPAARRIARLLRSDSVAECWAAVRALAQIGGHDAAPAVEFMIRALPTASEVDGYNMMIYLAMLGPVAREALPAIRTARIKNPVLRQATTWAIDPGDQLPWQGFFGDAEFARFIFGAYVQELGDHLRPVAATLARKIMAGTAGSVPPWGYKILARFPEEALPILTPGLAAADIVPRERAAVAIGYMGRAGAPARPQVKEALARAPGEKEQLLLRWCLRQID